MHIHVPILGFLGDLHPNIRISSFETPMSLYEIALFEPYQPWKSIQVFELRIVRVPEIKSTDDGLSHRHDGST